jgi:hypothetical protein
MTIWKLSPQYKKSAVELQFWYKDGKQIIREEGYRWATFSLEADTKPDIDLKNPDGEFELSFDEVSGNAWELEDMTDGCWAESRKGNSATTDEDLEEFDQAWEEDSYEGVEQLGWSNDDTEYVYLGPLMLTNADTGEEWRGEDNE